MQKKQFDFVFQKIRVSKMLTRILNNSAIVIIAFANLISGLSILCHQKFERYKYLLVDQID